MEYSELIHFFDNLDGPAAPAAPPAHNRFRTADRRWICQLCRAIVRGGACKLKRHVDKEHLEWFRTKMHMEREFDYFHRTQRNLTPNLQTGGRFQCRICGHRTAREGAMEKHFSRDHPGQRNYQYNDLVQNNPEYKENLDNLFKQCYPTYRSLHRTEDGRWICQLCGDIAQGGFGILIRHTDKQHIEIKLKLQCLLCRYWCKRWNEIYHHVRRDHPGQQDYPFSDLVENIHLSMQSLDDCFRQCYPQLWICNLCGHIAEEDVYCNLQTHVYEEHLIKRFQCSVCAYNDNDRWGIECHCSRLHPGHKDESKYDDSRYWQQRDTLFLRCYPLYGRLNANNY